ncbi:MAG: formylglycine-generating enzyme family protein, partial [Acidobacteriaceae bacterium]
MNRFVRCGSILFIVVLLFCNGVGGQDTAYPAKDAQIPGPASPADSRTWLADLQHWRAERLVRMGHNDANYARPEFKWTQHNFLSVQMMVEERDFYDPASGVYTVDKYLDDLNKEFGGVDSVLVWDTYPDLGVDNRNQFDRLRDLPGGIAGVRKMVADFHRRGVKILFPETPWDMGTRDEGAPDWAAQAKLMAEVGADGLLGDTIDGVPRAFLAASEKAGRPLVLQPEGLPSDEALAWNEMTWGYWSYPFVPMISRYKWLEHRHMPIVTSGGRHHIAGIQAAFFNGVGYADQEDVIGIHNGFTQREIEALRRVLAIERANADLLVSRTWEPYASTLQYGVFASKFSNKDQTLWTIINRNSYDVHGRQLTLPYTSGTRYFDLWRGVELVPQISSAHTPTAALSFDMGALGFGAVLAIRGKAAPKALDALLARMRVLSRTKFENFSDQWKPLRQHMVEIPRTTPAKASPPGMVLIPGGKFDFKVQGVSVAGGNQPGVDVQYPWEDSPRRYHNHVLSIQP